MTPHPAPTVPTPASPTALVVSDAAGRHPASSLSAAGWQVQERTIVDVLATSGPIWPEDVAVVVAVGGHPFDLAAVVEVVRDGCRNRPLVVIGPHPDRDLLERLLRAGGAIAYGMAGDDVVELVELATRARGCASSPGLAAELLRGLGAHADPRDLELVGLLLAGHERADLVAEVARRPELFAAVVDDAVERSLKRLALAAGPRDRVWLAQVLDR